jgi:hypothetical protein
VPPDGVVGPAHLCLRFSQWLTRCR